MTIDITQESAAQLPAYSRIPIAFQVTRILELTAGNDGLDGFRLEERPVTPWIKDYDAHEPDRPLRWPETWDLANWGFFAAFRGGQRVGGAAVAHDTPGIHKLEDRQDIAVLWDIRVHPDYRGQGIGALLFQRAAEFARARGCRCLKAETQSINVPACHFYRAQGCVLGSINRYAYRDYPNEVELVWYLLL